MVWFSWVNTTTRSTILVMPSTVPGLPEQHKRTLGVPTCHQRAPGPGPQRRPRGLGRLTRELTREGCSSVDRGRSAWEQDGRSHDAASGSGRCEDSFDVGSRVQVAVAGRIGAGSGEQAGVVPLGQRER